MTSEHAVQNALRAEASRLGCALWRNNSGVLYDARGVPVRFGLANDSKRLNDVFKSSDLIGLHGGTGRFLAIECKPPGWTTPRNARERAQQAFIEHVRQLGGIGGFATSVEDFWRILNV
jgi:hypothetical protein